MKKLGTTWISTETETGIYGFFGSYRWLSNFWLCQVEFDGLRYPSSEAAYMAGKTEDKSIRLQLTKLSPGDAKRLGRSIQLRSDWETVKFSHMKVALVSKFTLNPDLLHKLKNTAPKYLEETNYWGDRIWGVCKGTGENNLGKLLMEVRDEL